MLNPLEVTTMTFGAKNTNQNQISAARVYFTGSTDAFMTSNLLGTLPGPTANAFNFTFTNSVELDHGDNFF